MLQYVLMKITLSRDALCKGDTCVALTEAAPAIKQKKVYYVNTTYDFIIIGTGAGGGTLLYALRDSGAKALVVEPALRAQDGAGSSIPVLCTEEWPQWRSRQPE